MKFTFGDIVVVDERLIGVVVKSWDGRYGQLKKRGFYHEVYVRNYNSIVEYHEDDIERYMVRHKELSDEEYEYQHSA